MIPTIEFHVYGEPKGQPRVKAFCRGKHAGIYTPGTADNWKLQVAIAWDKAKPAGFTTLECPVELKVRFFMPRPKSHFGKKGLKESAPHWFDKTPDFDNLVKAIMDQLTQCGVWRDDRLVCRGVVEKRYGDATWPLDETPTHGATITINELEP